MTKEEKEEVALIEEREKRNVAHSIASEAACKATSILFKEANAVYRSVYNPTYEAAMQAQDGYRDEDQYEAQVKLRMKLSKEVL